MRTFFQIWIVSDCDSKKGAVWRYEYMQKLLAAGLDIDLYGECFGNEYLVQKEDKESISNLIKKYRFYLSFENSLHCKDYITEKFFENALKNDAVPIVWGPSKKDVNAVAPLDSFIHSEDFSSHESLVKYLQHLQKDRKAYRRYFRWREGKYMTNDKMNTKIKSRYKDINIPPQMHGFENLCNKLTRGKLKRKTVRTYTEFLDEDSSECLDYY